MQLPPASTESRMPTGAPTRGPNPQPGSCFLDATRKGRARSPGQSHPRQGRRSFSPLVVFRIRVPVRLDLLFVVQVDMLRFSEFVQALFAQFSRMAGLTHASKRTGIVVGQRIVDPERAGRDPFHGLHGPLHVVGVDVCAQSISGIIRQLDGVVDVANSHDGEDRAKSLGLDQSHLLPYIHHDGWFVKESLFENGRSTPTRENPRAISDGFFHARMYVLELCQINGWPDVGIWVHPVAQFQRTRKSDDAVGEIVRDGLEYIEAFRSRAELTRIQIRCPTRWTRDDFQIGITAHDEGIVAPKLEMSFLDLSGADLCDALTGLDRSCQRHQVRAFMTDQRLANFLSEAGDDVHNARRKLSKHSGKR